MNTKTQQNAWANGFTMLELTVILAISALVIAMLLPILANAQRKAHVLKCDGRLGCVGLAYRIFATDHGDRFPWELTTNTAASFDTYFNQLRGLSNELSTPVILVCPADTRKPAKDWATLSRANLSYFAGLTATEGSPQAIMGGDRNVTTNGIRIGPGIVKVTPDFKLGWDNTMHRSQGSVLFSDGSCQTMTSARLRQQIANTAQNSMTFAVP